MTYEEYEALKREVAIHVGVALALARPKLRRDYASGRTGYSDPAMREMSDDIAKALIQLFEMTPRPVKGRGHEAQAWSPPQPPRDAQRRSASSSA